MDLKSYLQILKENSDSLNETLLTCTSEQLKFRKENSWNPLEIAEHILRTERLVLSFLLKPSESKSETEELLGFEKLNKLIVQFRARKVKAPEMLEPKGEFTDVKQFLKCFNEQRTLLKSALENDRIKTDNRIYKHPYLGEMTLRDWLYFIPLHAQRHLDQMKELLGQIVN